MSTRPSGRLISTTSAHDPSPSAPISTSLKTQATYPPSVRERVRKYPTAVAPPISRRSRKRPVFGVLGRLGADALLSRKPLFVGEIAFVVLAAQRPQFGRHLLELGQQLAVALLLLGDFGPQPCFALRGSLGCLSGVSGKWDATSLGLERYTGYRSGLGRLR